MSPDVVLAVIVAAVNCTAVVFPIPVSASRSTVALVTNPEPLIEPLVESTLTLVLALTDDPREIEPAALVSWTVVEAEMVPVVDKSPPPD